MFLRCTGVLNVSEMTYFVLIGTLNLNSINQVLFVLSSVRSFVRSSGHILSPLYLTNDLNNFDKTDGEYLVAATDDLITCWRSKVKVTR